MSILFMLSYLIAVPEQRGRPGVDVRSGIAGDAAKGRRTRSVVASGISAGNSRLQDKVQQPDNEKTHHFNPAL
jgi:hypothetical protein